MGSAVCVSKLPVRNNATIVINACNHRRCWNLNGATIVKATFFLPLLHRMGIKWRRRSTRTILKWKSKIQMNPRRIVRLYDWHKAKTFCCAFFAAAMLTMVAAATIVRFPPVPCPCLISSPGGQVYVSNVYCTVHGYCFTAQFAILLVKPSLPGGELSDTWVCETKIYVKTTTIMFSDWFYGRFAKVWMKTIWTWWS